MQSTQVLVSEQQPSCPGVECVRTQHGPRYAVARGGRSAVYIPVASMCMSDSGISPLGDPVTNRTLSLAQTGAVRLIPV